MSQHHSLFATETRRKEKISSVSSCLSGKFFYLLDNVANVMVISVKTSVHVFCFRQLKMKPAQGQGSQNGRKHQPSIILRKTVSGVI